MIQERVSRAMLLTRVQELYSAGTLDHAKTHDSELIQRYELACSEVSSSLGVLERREWSSYGQGFASFVESWFYRPEKPFEAEKYDSERYSYRGVSVVFSLLEPMFITYESEKRWSDDGDSGILPSLNTIDNFNSTDTRTLNDSVCSIIRKNSIPQASKQTLDAPIDSEIKIESNMSFGELRLFDAFFHWAD